MPVGHSRHSRKYPVYNRSAERQQKYVQGAFRIKANSIILFFFGRLFCAVAPISMQPITEAKFRCTFATNMDLLIWPRKLFA
jgi:hypothetical protein